MATSKSSNKNVRYIGTSDVRIITAAQWEDAGVKNQAKTVWDVRNGWKLPLSDFTDNALDYFKNDAGFVVDAD